MQNTENTKEIELEIIQKIPDELLSEHLKMYCTSSNFEGYAKIGLVIFPILFLIHNVFLAGKSFNYKTYETIKVIELSIIGILVFCLIILAIIAMNLNSKLNKKLKESAKRYGVKIELMEQEFSLLAVYIYGGRGVKLKKTKDNA